jgi:acyl-coenzyme A thioesterase PaaI-like protein
MSKMPAFLTKLLDPSQMPALWNMVKTLPGGGKLMGQLIGRMAPYTGSIKAEIVELSPGHARVRMRDRRFLRNHLNSVHAIALMNLGEMTTGAAMLSSLPPNTRGIPVRLTMDYLKKARGTITGSCTCELIPDNSKREVDVHGELSNENGDVVAKMHARWQLGPTS